VSGSARVEPIHLLSRRRPAFRKRPRTRLPRYGVIETPAARGEVVEHLVWCVSVLVAGAVGPENGTRAQKEASA